MRALVQRVTHAEVHVEGREVGSIERGLLVFLGVAKGDTREDVEYLCGKISGMRIFEDDGGKMNLSVEGVNGAVLLVSQFTLCADLSRGRRPGFDRAAPPEEARALYHHAIETLSSHVEVQTGSFGAHMDVSLVNDGPATFWLDTTER